MEQDKDFDNSLEESIEQASLDKIDETLENEAGIVESEPEENISDTIEPELVENIEPVVSDEDYANNNAKELITVRPVKFQEFEQCEPNRSIKKNLDILQDVSMHISVELGKSRATIKEVMDYKEGSIVELDKIAGEQVEVYANNKLIAKGEVIVIEDKFGVRVTSTNLPKTIQ